MYKWIRNIEIQKEIQADPYSPEPEQIQKGYWQVNRKHLKAVSEPELLKVNPDNRHNQKTKQW